MCAEGVIAQPRGAFFESLLSNSFMRNGEEAPYVRVFVCHARTAAGDRFEENNAVSLATYSQEDISVRRLATKIAVVQHTQCCRLGEPYVTRFDDRCPTEPEKKHEKKKNV